MVLHFVFLHRGIVNGGNYCFLNTSVQTLLAMHGVKELVFELSGKGPGEN
ncbi:unnamed protein product [Ectocarpus fasciculatus]